MKHIKLYEEHNNNKVINSEGYEYISNGEMPKPGDYAYLMDGDNVIICKITNDRTYPDAKDEGDLDSYENVWNIEVINTSEIEPNYWSKKVVIPESYHLSHFKRGGKIIASNNPNIKL